MTRDDAQHKPLTWRLYLILAALLLCVMAVIWKLANLHVLQNRVVGQQKATYRAK